ncbi:MAG: SDR family NAD(P)-dependent oxidoreductase [Bacteroidota bacterium]
MRSYALITGAAGGLGKAFAAECAARGWDLFLTDLAEPSLALLAGGLSRLYNVDIQYFACNLTDPAAREALWETIRERGLQFHLLINVAGIDFEGPFAERRPDELDAIVRLNVEATVAMTRRVLEHRDKTRTLRIINVSSLAGFYPMPVKAVYAASKRFLLQFSLALRCELRGEDATVTALCPAGMPSNPRVVRSIDAQGFMGRLTARNVGFVAAKTIDRSLAGRAVYIPGAINLFLSRLGGLVPPSLAAAFIGRRWRKARKQYGEEVAFH